MTITGLVFFSFLAAIAALLLWSSYFQTFIFSLVLLALAILAVRFWLVYRKNILLVAISFFLSLAFVETMLRLSSSSSQSVARYGFNPLPYFDDKEISYWAYPDSSTLATKIAPNGERIFRNVPYVFDKLGRRTCEKLDLSNHPYEVKDHLILFGCSFLFGEGLASDDIVACNLQQKHPNTKVANYAKQGFGPSEAFMLLKHEEYFKDINPSKGRALFFFIGDHISRTVGSLDRLTLASNKRLINWRLNDQHVAVSEEVPQIFYYITKLRLLSSVADLGVLALSKYFETPVEEGILITVDILRQIKTNYLARFPAGSFSLIIWPRRKLEGDVHRKFIEALTKAGVEYLDIPYRDPPFTGTIHPLDGHPSIGENQYVAQAINDFLRDE